MRFNNKNILIIDDEPDMLEFLSFVLLKQGYNVISTTSPLEAVNLLTNISSINLVLSDIKMPELSGIELFQNAKHAIKKNDDTMPEFIFITAGHDDLPEDQLILFHSFTVIEKPFPLDLLLKQVSYALSKK